MEEEKTKDCLIIALIGKRSKIYLRKSGKRKSHDSYDREIVEKDFVQNLKKTAKENLWI